MDGINAAVKYLNVRGVELPDDLKRDILSLTIKAESGPSRDELERKLARAILKVDRVYLAMLENGGVNVPFDYWQVYADDIRKEIAAPLRKYIETSFTNYSDYVNYIDKIGAVGEIDTLMTREITRVAQGIADNTRKNLQALIAEGISQDEIIERIALRFGAGHAEQVAITEITRAEGLFSEALSGRLEQQGVQTQIRWLTAEDERVCPVCGPADHKLKDEPITGYENYIGEPRKGNGGWNGMSWGQRFPGGPPAHPNCRCQTVVEVKPTKSMKHYPGGQDHDQSTHGSGGGGSRGDSIASIKQKELSIRNITTHEEALITDADGNTLFEKRGKDGAGSVEFTKEEIRKIRENGNVIITHNHPFTSSLSNGDVEFAFENNLAEMRAVDAKYTYVIERPESGWVTIDPDTDEYWAQNDRKKKAIAAKSLWQKEANSQAAQMVKEYKSGNLRVENIKDYINENASHNAMLKVSEKYGFKYTRTEK